MRNPLWFALAAALSAASLLACAGTRQPDGTTPTTAPATPTPPAEESTPVSAAPAIPAPDPTVRPEAPVREGDSLVEARSRLGAAVEERDVSPTEKVLSALWGPPCGPEVRPGGPRDASLPPCGAAWLLRVRVVSGKVVAVEWAEPPAR